ncbi:hypothetical protein pb186bvf_000992 [Paramecium bursaria]
MLNVDYRVIFKGLKLSIDTDIRFNIEMKSRDGLISLANDMTIGEQYEQSMNAFAKIQDQQQKPRKVLVVLKNSNVKKIAGWILFDIGQIAKINVKQYELTKTLQNCPDKESKLSIKIILTQVQYSDQMSNLTPFMSNNSNESDLKKTQEVEYICRQNIQLQQQLTILQKQMEFIEKQNNRYQQEFEKYQFEKQLMQQEIDQLCQFNMLCIEKIKWFEQELLKKK